MPPNRAVQLLHAFKRALIGSPQPTSALREVELPKRLALPIFSADPLSSVAYATEQMMIVLFAVSISGTDLIMPLALVIAALLALVVASYRQTVRAYTTSGGAYAVARDNLGARPALVAASALLVDYVLTVAVSVSAGVTAITSAYPSLASLRLPMALSFIAVLTLVNLRGVRETGLALAAPMYAFVVVVLATIAVGLVRCAGECPHAAVPDPLPVGSASASLGVFVVLRAFASGSAALTGIEAISNGVSAFRRPKGVNAARTLTVMGAIAITLFLGVSYLAVEVHAAPSRSVSVLSEIARAVMPGTLFYVVQLLTFAILVLAANSAFQGFPRLAGQLARDDYLPSAFEDLGDRLVHSNGILVLAALATALVVAFGASVDSLVQLYLLGVFVAFTLSQAGMVRYWRRTRGRSLSPDAGEGIRWRRSLAINALGAAGTGLVAVIVLATKFTHGAWIAVAAMAATTAAMTRLHRHYQEIKGAARRGAVQVLQGPVHHTVLLAVEAGDAAVGFAREYANHLEADAVETVGVDDVLARVRSLERPDERGFVTVVLRRRRALALRLRLRDEPGVVVTDVPAEAPERIDANRSAALLIVRAVDDPTVYALNYSRAVHDFRTRALYFALYPNAAGEVAREWERRELPVPLEVVDCPFREIGGPLLDELRAVTGRPGAVAAVVLPDLVTGTRLGRYLDDRRSLYVKWLLLYEPRTVISDVPYQLLSSQAPAPRARAPARAGALPLR